VLRRHRAVIFVNGCFWHGHGCKFSKMPDTRAEFWRQKISRTKARDSAATQLLLGLGWNVIVVWECSLRGRDQVARTSAWASIRMALAKRHPTISEVVPLY
jgi:DNA mismatch endonuclease (patch repair protein)